VHTRKERPVASWAVYLGGEPPGGDGKKMAKGNGRTRGGRKSETSSRDRGLTTHLQMTTPEPGGRPENLGFWTKKKKTQKWKKEKKNAKRVNKNGGKKRTKSN